MPVLDWLGKDKVINHHSKVPFHFLEKKFSVGSADNKIIHADNLFALKSLLPSYEGRVKCIYIDPPYNTGNEGWIYNDAVNDPQIKRWLGQVVGKEGEDFTRHDKWLCMMYPRLRLMQKFLSDDGAIFISINFRDEYYSLRWICDEIFGANCYVGTLTWESLTQPTNSGRAKFGLQIKTEAIICYRNNAAENIFELKTIKNEKKYPHVGKFGACRFEVIETSDAGTYGRSTMKFKILGQPPREGKRWKIGEDTARQLEAAGRVEIVDGIVKKAIYPEDEAGAVVYKPFWSHLKAEDVGTAQSGKEILNSIMGKAIGFDTVKPPALIEELLCHFDKDSIVLDAFAGSGTTAHAVINLNAQDGGNRKFILIELMDYAEKITAERVRRVGGEFDFYELGEPLFDAEDFINKKVPRRQLFDYVYFSETGKNYSASAEENLLGVDEDTAYYFFDGAELNYDLLATIRTRATAYVIYADNCTLSEKFLGDKRITFKKIPSDIRRY